MLRRFKKGHDPQMYGEVFENNLRITFDSNSFQLVKVYKDLEDPETFFEEADPDVLFAEFKEKLEDGTLGYTSDMNQYEWDVLTGVPPEERNPDFENS